MHSQAIQEGALASHAAPYDTCKVWAEVELPALLYFIAVAKERSLSGDLDRLQPTGADSWSRPGDPKSP